LRILAGVLLVLAVGVALAGVLSPARVAEGMETPTLTRLAIAAAVAALAQLAQLRFKVGPGMIGVAWGEAALVIGLYLVPAAWLPAAFFIGAAVAGALIVAFSERRTVFSVVHITGSLTVASAAGAAVVVAANAVLPGRPNPYDVALTLTTGAVLVVAALVYLGVTVGLATATGMLRHGLRVGDLLPGTLRGKALMFIGNVVIGLLIIAAVEADLRWLILVAPGLWLLQQTYADRLRAGVERRAWQSFAAATRALNQLDERGVAVAGVQGAVMLFGPERVDVEVTRLGGLRHRYTGNGTGDVEETEISDAGPAARPATGRAPAPESEIGADDSDPGTQDGWGQPRVGFAGGQATPATPRDGVATRPLVVGGAPVGELRLHFPKPAALGPRDQNMLSAFSDALGAALHDAATHRELQAMSARTSHDALHDPLTGLINRATLLVQGDAMLQTLDIAAPAALLLLDVDHFKEVNDTLGHAAGDTLLQTTAVRLSGLIRAGELLARLGGDEFAMLLTALPTTVEPGGLRDRPAPLVYALRRARELTEQLASPTEVAGVQLSVEASVGVVVAPAGSADMTELLRRADIAMYQAKEGGASVAWYDSARDAASTDRLALIAELREALACDDQLVLALQPAVDLITGAPTGVEALIRWKHPRRGMLGPADFVRAVENSELLAPFTRYVLDKALTSAAEWAAHGLDVPVAVNLSARNLLDPRLPADVAELLRSHRLSPHRLVLEITETVVMSELEVVDEVLAALRELGVQLAVDDFGTGYSSLTFLTRVAVDELKVDRTFVGKMADSAEAAAIVRTTVDLARELGLRVVAEGVETAEQRNALTALGCTAAQGFHFFRPMPAENVLSALLSLSNSATETNVVPLRADGVS
jgi:diguanylate cyclase (GGDEF)-like protein